MGRIPQLGVKLWTGRPQTKMHVSPSTTISRQQCLNQDYIAFLCASCRLAVLVGTGLRGSSLSPCTDLSFKRRDLNVY